jgi:hypothetical protein
VMQGPYVSSVDGVIRGRLLTAAPPWCSVVHAMATVSRSSQSDSDNETERVSVTFPRPHYSELQRIAEDKRVSVAWVVRDAVREYLAAQIPLFRDQV